jgi:hypothetical protein
MIVLDTSVPAEFVEQEQPDDQPIACLTSLDSEAGDLTSAFPPHIEKQFRFFRFFAILAPARRGRDEPARRH